MKRKRKRKQRQSKNYAEKIGPVSNEITSESDMPAPEDSPVVSTGRWEHLIEISFRLSNSLESLESDESEKKPVLDKKDLGDAINYLDDLLEIFGNDIDPLNDLPGYGVRRLCLPIRELLSVCERNFEKK